MKRFLMEGMAVIIILSGSIPAFAEDFVIPPGFEEAYKRAHVDCQNRNLPPQQIIDACNLAVKIATMDSEIKARNAKNGADAALGKIITDSLRSR